MIAVGVGLVAGILRMDRPPDEIAYILLFGYWLWASIGVCRSADAVPMRWRPGDPHIVSKAKLPWLPGLAKYLVLGCTGAVLGRIAYGFMRIANGGQF